MNTQYKQGDKVKILNKTKGSQFAANQSMKERFISKIGIVGSVYNSYITIYPTIDEKRTGCTWEFNFSDIEPINKELIINNKNMGLKESFALIGVKEPERSFRKVGLTDDKDKLTLDGKDVVLNFLLDKYKDDVKKDIVDEILKEQEKK